MAKCTPIPPFWNSCNNQVHIFEQIPVTAITKSNLPEDFVLLSQAKKVQRFWSDKIKELNPQIEAAIENKESMLKYLTHTFVSTPLLISPLLCCRLHAKEWPWSRPSSKVGNPQTRGIILSVIHAFLGILRDECSPSSANITNFGPKVCAVAPFLHLYWTFCMHGSSTYAHP